MKKIITMLLAFTLLIPLCTYLCTYVLATDGEGSDGIKIYVDGERVITENAPVIENSRTLAPIRAVAEKAGIYVGWNGDSSTVTLKYEFQSANITIGSSTMTVYNSVIDEMQEVTLDAVPRIINSSTYITLRAALEAVGAGVDWEAESQSIYVTSPKKSGEAVTDSNDAAENNTDNSNTPDENKKNETTPEKTDAENTVLGYEGFRSMENDSITEGAPHGLYGKITSELPITFVRCRIVGTEFDEQLSFDTSENITDYNVFTHFDRLMCFSDAGLGAQTFEIYAAAKGEKPELLFSYEYTVLPKEAPADETVEAEENNAENNSENNTEDISEDNSETESENGSQGENDTENEEIVPVVSYYGFRKMTDNKIIVASPHGLYGNVISNVPLTGVRCRIVGTKMDYSISLDSINEITLYNVFNYFDKLICFSDAGLGAQTFEIYATAEGTDETLVFSYEYTVITEEENEKEEIGENAPQSTYEYEVCLPLEGDIRLTSPYGFRAYNKWEFHKGIDIISSSSLNILAVADGVVVDCKKGINSGAGNYVAIQHEDGWVSLYYHLKSYNVSIGDKVEMGEVIATMGNSGGNYGVHLHFMTCDGWYGNLWSTQNSHHTAPHEYVPQILPAVENYTPNYEKENKDKVIICNFHFPSEIEQGKPYSISCGDGFFAFEADFLESVTVTVTDSDGNILIDETEAEPKVYSDGYYNYSNVSAELDMLCKFDELPLGKMTLYISAVTGDGRERVVYTKEFEVKESEVEVEAEAEAETEIEAEIEAEAESTEEKESEESSEAENTGENAEIDENLPENGMKNEGISESENGISE